MTAAIGNKQEAWTTPAPAAEDDAVKAALMAELVGNRLSQMGHRPPFKDLHLVRGKWGNGAVIDCSVKLFPSQKEAEEYLVKQQQKDFCKDVTKEYSPTYLDGTCGYQRIAALTTHRSWSKILPRSLAGMIGVTVLGGPIGFGIYGHFFSHYAAYIKITHICYLSEKATAGVYYRDMKRFAITVGHQPSMKAFWDKNAQQIKSYKNSSFLNFKSKNSGFSYIMLAPLGDTNRLEISVQADQKGDPIPEGIASINRGRAICAKVDKDNKG